MESLCVVIGSGTNKLQTWSRPRALWDEMLSRRSKGNLGQPWNREMGRNSTITRAGQWLVVLYYDSLLLQPPPPRTLLVSQLKGLLRNWKRCVSPWATRGQIKLGVMGDLCVPCRWRGPSEVKRQHAGQGNRLSRIHGGVHTLQDELASHPICSVIMSGSTQDRALTWVSQTCLTYASQRWARVHGTRP